MKIITLISVALFMTLFSQGQLNDSVNYFIKKAAINHKSYSDNLISRGQYLSFYKNEFQEKYFRNSSADGSEYSYGRVTDIQFKGIKGKKGKIENISFCWNYHNSYDNETGFATVKLKRIHFLNGVVFDIIIKSENKKYVIEYSGYTNEINDNNQTVEIDYDVLCKTDFKLLYTCFNLNYVI
jgi:hypothetical protein